MTGILDDRGDAPRSARPPASRPASRGSAPSCHGDSGGVDAGPGVTRVALVGAPNVGKSTLFNAITGARRTVGNWPGTTVEVGSGVWPGTERTGRGGAPGADPVSRSPVRMSPRR